MGCCTVVLGALSCWRVRVSVLPGLNCDDNDDSDDDGDNNQGDAEPLAGVLVEPLGIHQGSGSLLHVLYALGHLPETFHMSSNCPKCDK